MKIKEEKAEKRENELKRYSLLYPVKELDPVSYSQQMYNLIQDERIPVSISEILKARSLLPITGGRRLSPDGSINSTEVKYYDPHRGWDRMRVEGLMWKKDMFLTADAMAVHNSGRVKICLDSKLLMDISPHTKLRDDSGFLPLTEEQYQELAGLELTPREVKKYSRGFTIFNRFNPVWRYISRDMDLLKKYRHLEKRFPTTSPGRMRIHFPPPEKVPVLAPLGIGTLSKDIDKRGWGRSKEDRQKWKFYKGISKLFPLPPNRSGEFSLVGKLQD